MDNITHSLFGYWVAEGAVQLRRKRLSPERLAVFRASALAASIAGNNLPDLDFVYTRVTEGPLGYLMHHRGHTHTFVLAIVQGLLIWGAIEAFRKWRGRTWGPGDRTWVAALAILGSCLHILADGMNNYGIHPYWPLDNAWRAGDFIFIIEPWFWAVLIPPLIGFARTWATRVFLGILLLGMAGLVFASGFVPLSLGLAWLGLIALWSWGARQLRAGGLSWGVGSLGLIWVIAGFAVLSADVRAQVTDLLRRPGLELYSVSLHPLPTNPYCWRFTSSEVLSSGVPEPEYRTRAGVFAWGGSPLERCVGLSVRDREGEIPWSPEPALESRLQVFKSFSAPLEELRVLAREECTFGAFLRFARHPYWKIEEGIAGDLRYDFSGRGGFARVQFERGQPSDQCPKNIPPWEPWLKGLLAKE